ncbi:MAG TPA: response regulator transcription factor [Anaerolineae bacterium]|nr:response regulator transcription factor [Anaerolineae bacterium]HPL26865.1 response regulator transcription factor [Anaerolineae bacterium]
MPAKATILVVDDEPHVVRLVQANLQASGYQVLTAGDGRTALAIVDEQRPDLVLLDLMMPGLDGYEVCRRIREHSDVPIIMLTARGAEVDKIAGLDAGADDYLTKPFGVGELLARVRAVLRRCRHPEEVRNQPPFRSGDLTIDFARHEVTVAGQRVALSATEYRLLAALARHADRVMLHEELLREVWGPEYRDEREYLRVYVRYLRQKLEADPANPRLILTQQGAGYRLAALPPE